VKKAIISFIAVLIALMAVLFIYAGFKPNTFRVERSACIKARPEKIYTLIENFRGWDFWSPWNRLDPGMKKMFNGAAKGTGSVYEWEGNDKVGKGRMEITETTSLSKIVIKLDFLKPFESHNITEFTLTPRGDSTQVRWIMYGPNRYMAKVMEIFFSIDNMIGKDFEAGLANLKSIAEK
jgi:Polyketide cyclase / dehydrase and lipid transport